MFLANNLQDFYKKLSIVASLLEYYTLFIRLCEDRITYTNNDREY